ncbi:MAG: transposase [Victivallales bacterium]|nr:transposase [Victivallales bacterium]
MSRPVNPATAYRLVAHTTHGHVYASVQRTVVGKDGRNVRRHRHYGVLEGNKFTPWAEFLALPGEERAKFVFPPEWDLSLLDRLSDRRGPGRPVLDCEARNRLYGDIWLLEQIAEKTKIRRDLEVVFDGNKEMVDAIMALAMFPYLTKFSFSRVERWQRNVKSPCDFPLSPKTITKLTQSITERHRTELLSLRASRLGKDEFCAVDSTSRSAYGDSLADIRWGKNKEHLPLEQILSVVVYTLSSHMPVYYRTFPGNMPDSRSLEVILKDLREAGFLDVALFTDRGYDSLKNMEKYILAGQAMLMSVKVGQKFVMDRIREFGSYDSCPGAMSIDPETELAFFQCDMEYEVESTNGRTKRADRLKLNLYLDARRRAMTLLRLRLELDSQRRELEELLRKRSRLDDAAGQDPREDDEGQDGGAEDDGGARARKGKDIRRACGYYNVFYDRRTRVMKSFEVNERKTASCRLLAGYFASVTHRLDFSPMEAYHHYKLRDEQEKYFEQMKDQMVADRQRCWSEEGWTGRQLILFVSLILGSQVRHVWRTKLKDKFSSSLEILDEMRCIRCIEHPGHARKITPFVGAQLEICEAFGFEPPKGCDKVYTSIRKQERKRGRPKKKEVEVNND